MVSVMTNDRTFYLNNNNNYYQHFCANLKEYF